MKIKYTMKTKLILTLLLCTSLVQAQVNVDWFNYPGGVSLAMDSVNNVYTANWDYNPAGDITLTKRDAAGNILWDASYSNTDNTRHEVATWVETDHDGNILVSGTIRSGFSNPVNAASVLMKFNGAGTLLWRVVYENNFDGSSTRKCLIDANNNIYVLGIGTGSNGQVTKVKKFDANGGTVWNYFDSLGLGAPVTFKFTGDNNIVIIHRSVTGILNGYSKISLSGNKIWTLAGMASTSLGDAAGDAFGNTYIVNGTPSQLRKLSPNGALIWSQPNPFNGNKVEVGTDNNPVVGGYPAVNYGVVIAKYNSAGNFLWQNLDADGPGLALLALAPMRLDASNAAYIAGSTMSSMGLCKVNSDGTSAWAATTSSGYPVWFAFGTDNNVYVTGGTTARFVQVPPVITCNAPINLSVTNITGSSAKMKWTGIPNIIRYTLYYKKSTDSTWTKVNPAKSKTSWIVNNLVCNATYKWKIRTVCDTVGVNTISTFSPVQTFTTGVCRMGDQELESQNNVVIYPNPVNDITTVSFDADGASDVSILFFDAMGREVNSSILQNISEGRNEIPLDLSALKSGIYFCRISVDGSTEFIRIIKN